MPNSNYSGIFKKTGTTQPVPLRKKDDGDEYVIRHTPNRLVLLCDKMKWYWPVMYFFGAFLFYVMANPASTNRQNIPLGEAAILGLLLVLVAMIFLPFYIGVKLGANLFRPQDHELTKRQERLLDEILREADGDVEVSLIRRDGQIKILGKEKEEEKPRQKQVQEEH